MSGSVSTSRAAGSAERSGAGRSHRANCAGHVGRTDDAKDVTDVDSLAREPREQAAAATAAAAEGEGGEGDEDAVHRAMMERVVPRAERHALGHGAKRLLDAGRVRWLKKRGATAELVRFIDAAVSPENRLLLATVSMP